MHGLSTIKRQNKSTHKPYDSHGNKVAGECLNTLEEECGHCKGECVMDEGLNRYTNICWGWDRS